MRHRLRHLVACLAVSCVVARGASAAATAKKISFAGQPAIVLENEFLRMTFAPGRGGECVDFVFKPAGKRLVLPGEGSLLGSRVWNYADKDLYIQWQRNPWEYELRRAAGQVTLVLRAAGRVGFTRHTVFEKRVTLREGEAMARVVHVFRVGQQLMVPQKIGLWFFNKCGVVGEPNTYYFPLDEGIAALGPNAGQAWFYHPARGWLACVGRSGAGLAFTMEFRRLMCFYACPGRQPTFEWAFRTFDVPNGGSLRTEEEIIAFAGLPRVNGAGAGLVAGVDAPDKCSPAQARAGLPARIALAAGRAGEGELVVACQRLPDGEPMPVLRRRVRFAPAKTLTIPLKLALPREGTWALRGAVRSPAAKELMDFAAAVVVGKPSAAFRIEPKEPRIGRATERFEDRKPLRGSAPKDLTLSTDIETPHVPWARPYARGKLRVLVLTSCLNGREAVEMAERLDMEPIWVTAGQPSELRSFSRVFGRGVTFTPQHMNQYIREKLTQGCDAILIGGLRGSLFEDATLDLMRRKVREGVGLVYVGPNRGPDKLYAMLPVEKERHLRYRRGAWAAARPHYLTIGVPFEVLPRTDYTFYRAKTEPLATANRRPLLVAQDGPGRGRVVVLAYNTGWQGSGNWRCGITPWVRNAPERFAYWEYHFSLLAKALVWAARREADVTLESISTEPGAPPALVLRLRNDGPARRVDVWTRMTDAYGAVEGERTTRAALAKGAQTLRVALPKRLAGGLHLVDAIVRERGKSLAWGSAALRLDRGLTIENLAFDKKAYHPGETARITARLRAAKPAVREVEVRLQVTDSLDRLLMRGTRRARVAEEAAVEFAFPVGRPLATVARARVAAFDSGLPLAVAEADAITLPEKFARREWADAESIVWGNPAGAYARDYLIPYRSKLMHDYGITTVMPAAHWLFDTEYDSAVRAGFQLLVINCSYGYINVGHRVPKGKTPFAEARRRYQATHDKRWLVRPVCLNDPADLAPLADKLHKLAAFAGWLEPLGYNLGDEMSLTYYTTPFDYDFGDACLAAFRRWLRKRYPSLDALNRAWDTKFASWDAVTPMTAYEVKGRGNYAPWAEHREFMDETFARFFEWVRARLRERDPRAIVGMSGSQAAEAYGGYNWPRLMQALDFIQNYTHRNTMIMQRSFDGRVPRAPWYGYGVRNPQMRAMLWRRLLNGNRGGSFFSESYMFLPDGRPSACTRAAAPLVKEFQSGLAGLVRRLRRVNDIGVHYSHASIRGAFIFGADALFRDNRQGWIKALEDLGFQCEFLCRKQIEAGELRRRGYKAFVLPYSVAISDREAAELRRYVEAGGLLLADGKIGLMDEICRTRKTGALDALFGVSRPRVDPLAGLREGEAVFDSNEGACRLKGLKLDASAAEPGLRASHALGRIGSTPAAAVHRTGQGCAALLNFYLDWYPRQRALRMEAPLKQLVANLLKLRGVEPAVRVECAAKPAPRFYVVRFRAGAARYVAVQYDLGRREEPPPAPARYTVRFPARAHVYDVRRGAYLGRTDRASGRLGPGDVALYALLPYRVRGLDVRASQASARPGDEVRYAIRVRADGAAPGLHVFRVEVSGPDGKPRRHYGAVLCSEVGRAEGAFRLALNDPPGAWRIRVQILPEGLKGMHMFRVGRKAMKSDFRDRGR